MMSKGEAASKSETVRMLQVGIYDAPLDQLQPDLTIDLLSANVAVFGSKQSGKTTFIKNILVRLHEIIEPKELAEEIYILDLNSTMGDYEKLPFVCCCIDDSNEEDVKTLFKTVEDALKRNNDLLKQTKCSNIAQFLDDPPASEESPKHITLIIENLNAFLGEERFSLYHDLLVNFCRDGNSKGLTVIFSANGTTGGVSRYLPNMETIVAFNMPNDQSMDIFNEKPPQILHVAGRGIVRLQSKLYEFHGFLPFASEKQELLPFVQTMNESIPSKYRPTRLLSFTKSLTVDNFAENTYTKMSYQQVTEQEKGIVIGLDYYYHKPVCIVPDESRCIGIYGKKSFGKTNLLNLLVCSMLQQHRERIGHVILFDDGRNELKGLTQFIQENYQDIEVTSFFDRTLFRTYIATLRNERIAAAAAAAQQTKPKSQPPDEPKPAPPAENRRNSRGSLMTRTIDRQMENDTPKQQKESDSPSAPPPQQKDAQISEKKEMLFIIQSKSMYQSTAGQIGAQLEDLLSVLINNAEQYRMSFIFSDIKRHPTIDMETMISSFFTKAFLLNDIADFVENKGSKTAFGEFDAKEMKKEYAKCERGDGYFFDISRDVLIKMKFLKSPFNVPEK